MENVLLYYMNTTIKRELNEFQKYHENNYNILFHIFCGFIYMTMLILLFKPYRNIVLIIYTLLIGFTLKNLYISSMIFIILLIMVQFFHRYKIAFLNYFYLFIVFYFLPDISHYLTNEPSMLDISNITPFSIFVNIFYLLPFSLMCLFYSK